MDSAHSVHVGQFLSQAASRWPSKSALIDERGSISFAELSTLRFTYAETFRQHGLERGMGVALRGANGRFFVAALLALAELGAIVMPLPLGIKRAELDDFIREAGVQALVAQRGTTPSMTGAEVSLPESGGAVISYFGNTRSQPFAAHVPDAVFVRPTSGTTGRSKGVILSHATVHERVIAATAGLQISCDDRVAWVLPMASHFVVSLLVYLNAGATMLVTRDHLTHSIIETIRTHAATFLYASPTHFALLSEDCSGPGLPSLRKAICTSAGISPGVAQRFAERYGLPVTQVYGLIEVGLPLGSCGDDRAAAHSIGTPLPGYQAEIFDESYRPCARGSVGELAVRGPGIFDGYLNPPLLREEVLCDGWFLTGDLALQTDEGSFRVVGRKKSIINTAGNKVFPEEVEHVLNEHPAVLTSRVRGKVHELLGEVVVAAVALRPSHSANAEELGRFCRERLSSYKSPQEFSFVEQISMTANGKVRRY